MIRAAQPPAAHLLATGLCVGLAASLGVRAASPGVAVAAASLAVLSVALPRGRAVALVLALATAGVWWGSVRLAELDRSVLSNAVGEAALARVEITGPVRPSRHTIRIPVRVVAFDGRRTGEPAQLELPADAPAPDQGAILELVVQVRLPRGPAEPGSFDEAAYLRRRGMHVVLHGARFRIVGHRGGLAGAADALRARLASSVAPGLEGERRALVEGIVLGRDEGLDDALRDRFRASGLYHVLAVSGQNVAYVVAGVLLAAWLLGVPRAAAQIAALAAVAGYVVAVGWQPSVVRAGVAGALASLAWLASRPRDRWYFLLVGAAVLLAWSPYSLLDPGFQLSFAAVAAIFLLVPRLERRLEGYPVPRVLAAAVAVSGACGLVTAPILWLQFGTVPVWSVLANVLALPVVAPILGLGLLSAAASPALPDLAFALGWLNGWLAAYLAGCARLVGGLPLAQLRSGAALLGIALGVLVLVGVARAPARVRRPTLALALAAALGLAAWRIDLPRAPLPPPEGLRVSFLDVGQGDAILLQVPEGAVLVDQGPPEANVAERLRAFGVRSLSALVLTHPQRDHVGGAVDVLRSFPVAGVLDPGLPVESPDGAATLAAARSRGVPVVVARAGQRLALGRLRLTVLWPDGPGAPGEDPNGRAIVLLASFGDTDVLLTADAESDVTARLELPRLEVLKIAHHGSADEGLARLLERTRPLAAVVSVGERNDYGHPTRSTLAALGASRGTRTFRTDRDGTVVVESDGTVLTVRTWR